jgi:hypothetical protein
VLPGEVEGYGEAVAGTGQHHDRADAGRHANGRPDEEPRGDPAEHQQHDRRCG